MASHSFKPITGLFAQGKDPIYAEFFSEANVRKIYSWVYHILSLQFKTKIHITRESLYRVMVRIVQEMLEPIEKMNERVVMEVTADFRRNQIERNKHILWAERYAWSQKLSDPTSGTAKTFPIKLNNRLGVPRVGGTLRFRFT
jgi:restriction endonuclease